MDLEDFRSFVINELKIRVPKDQVRILSEEGTPITNMEKEVFSIKDALVNISTEPEKEKKEPIPVPAKPATVAPSPATQTPTPIEEKLSPEAMANLTPAERRRLDRLEMERKRNEKRDIEAQIRAAREQEQERKSQQNATLEAIRSQNQKNQEEQMSEFDKKVAAVENFGAKNETDPIEVRVFLYRPGAPGKPAKLRKNDPNYSWGDFVLTVREILAIPLKANINFLSLAKKAIPKFLDELHEDDFIFILLDEEMQNIGVQRQLDSQIEKLNALKQLESTENEKPNLTPVVSVAVQRLNLDKPCFTCSICLDDILRRDIYILDCGHKFCRLCLGEHVESAISMGGIIVINQEPGIICAENGCQQLIQAYEVKNLVDKSTYERYDLMLRDLAIESFRDTQWCPTPNCGNAIIKVSELPMLTFCFKCKFSECTQCKVPWHNDLSCYEYQKQRKEELMNAENQRREQERLRKKKLQDYNENLTLALIRKVSKTCPGCFNQIQKNGGCNHMTCKCRAQFCWLCQAIWRTCRCPQFT